MNGMRVLSAVGAGLAGLVTQSDVPPMPPAAVRNMLAGLGLVAADADEVAVIGALRAFQSDLGLTVDGDAGPETVHALVAASRAIRERHWFSLAA